MERFGSGGDGTKIHHEGTKGTKNTKRINNHFVVLFFDFLLCFFVFFVPSW
jgi:hypothetical protein